MKEYSRLALLVLFASSGILIPLGHGLVRDGYWRQIEYNVGEYYTLEFVRDTYCLSRSSLSCIAKCNRRRHQGCNAVIFDKISRACTLGEWIAKSSSPTSPSVVGNKTTMITSPESQVMYISKNSTVCDETIGFSLVTSAAAAGPTLPNVPDTACILASQGRFTYPEAKEDCKRKGGSLYMMKSVEKFEIHMNAATLKDENEYLWIGLEDVYRNTSYYWADGEFFDPGSSLWSVLWDSGQPGYPGGEFCASVAPSKGIHDRHCHGNANRYICERVNML